MSNFGFELGLQELGIPFARASVGDRYVLEMMEEKGWLLGGESSGHIVCGDATTTGDGIISALQILQALKHEARPLHLVKQSMQKMPQVMINVPVAQKVDIASNAEIQKAVEAVEAQLEKNGRVLLRASGTEPVVRVMIEGPRHDLVESLAVELADAVQRALSD